VASAGCKAPRGRSLANRAHMQTFTAADADFVRFRSDRFRAAKVETGSNMSDRQNRTSPPRRQGPRRRDIGRAGGGVHRYPDDARPPTRQHGAQEVGMPRLEVMKGRLTMAAMGLSILVLAAPAEAQDVDDAVTLHLKARGGAETWASIQSQRTTGTINAGGIELGMTLIVTRPNMMRQDLLIELRGQDPLPIHTAFDGTRAWAINPMSGSVEPQERSGAEAQSARDQADFDGPLIGYREKGHTVTLVGRETVAGRPALHLRIDRGSDPAIDYFIDA